MLIDKAVSAPVEKRSHVRAAPLRSPDGESARRSEGDRSCLPRVRARCPKRKRAEWRDIQDMKPVLSVNRENALKNAFHDVGASGVGLQGNSRAAGDRYGR